MNRSALLTCLVGGLAAICYGQSAQITGRITDPSGAIIPRAQLTVTNDNTGDVRKTETNSEGYYAVPLLPSGVYRIVAQSGGFRPAGRGPITLTVDQVARLDFAMELGSGAETVTVKAEAALIDSESATVGKVVENRRIQELPLNGRNALALAMFTPGVKSNSGPTQSGFLDRGVAVSALSINGGVGATNNFLLDGVNNLQGYHNDVNANPTVDAIEEFKVESNTMSAKYGFTGGGVINMVTKSGTNNPHGTLYEFVRNDAFDARNTFADSVAPFRYNQFGGSLGGPLGIPRLYRGKDRTFFFFNYEGWRYRRYDNPIYTVPTAAQRGGDFSNLRDVSGKLIPIYDPASTRLNPSGSGYIRDLFPSNTIPTARLDPVSVNMLQFYPLPNRTPVNQYTNSLNFIGRNLAERQMQQYMPKLDHRFSDRNSLSGRFSYFNHYTTEPITGGVLPDRIVRDRVDNVETRNVALNDTWTISPRLLNELRFGIARLYFPFQVLAANQGWPQKLGLPASVPSPALPYVTVDGLPNIVEQYMGLRTSLSFQIVNNMTYVAGKHTLTYGFDLRRTQVSNYQPTNGSGSYSFPAALTGNPQAQAGTGSGLATFLTGSVNSASLTSYLGRTMLGHWMSYFFQDDWKISRRLTLNLGIRHDFQQYPYERRHGSSSFEPFERNPDNGLMGRLMYAGVDYGASRFLNNRNDWGPRFGFAYDVSGKGQTVVRGGYSIFYLSNFHAQEFGGEAGFSATTTSYQAPAANFPAFQFRNGLPYAPTPPLGSRLGPSGLLGSAVTWSQSERRTPMSQQWNLAVQHRLPGNWLLDATYTANRGSRLASNGWDENQLDPKYLELGIALQNPVPNPYAGKVPGTLGAATITRQQSLKPYPYYTSITVDYPHIGSSTYHGLLLSGERRMASGLTVLASYTAGKIMSMGTKQPQAFTGEQYSLTGYRDGKYNRALDWSTDPTDVSQRLAVSGLYILPFGAGKALRTGNRALNSVIGGWQANTILVVQTGVPVSIRGASNNLADRPNSTGVSAKLDDRNSARWFDTTQFINPPSYTYGNAGRILPDVRNPGVLELDFSLVKNTKIRERAALQFRAEAFNALNHVNLGLVNGTFSPGTDGKNRSATFGIVSSAREARMLQLGMKLIF